jgi:NTE family protein
METAHLPVRSIEPGERDVREGPAAGTALCLSGGGYRAMLFHAGALKCLNDAGYLPRLERVSSVSGGSIAAGVLGMNWRRLKFRGDVAVNFHELVTAPLRRLAEATIDVCSVAWGLVLPGGINDQLAAAYRRHLFGDRTLQDLPDDGRHEGPRFVFNATSMQSGVLMRFSRPYLADYRVGMVLEPRLALAEVVAASSAFPPFLSPATIDMSGANWVTERGNDLVKPEYRKTVVLADGGVYDNLGLETAWKRYRTVLVSDGGGHVGAERAPHSDWPRQTMRVFDLVDNQVRSLRKRQLIDSYELPSNDIHHRNGTYWGIRSDVADYHLQAAPHYPFTPATCPHGKTLGLADLPTRLAALDELTQKRLINWGYAIANVALRRWVNPALEAKGFPYPRAGIG